MNKTKEDARFLKTRKVLENTVLGLAAERDISEVSVAELARKAGINRSTFYDHANSPIELFTRILSRELDEIFESGLDGLKENLQPREEVMEQTLNRIVDHLLIHKSIYTGTNRASSAYALRVVLFAKLFASAKAIITDKLARPPSRKKEDWDLYASYIAHGVIGVIESWLGMRGKKDRKQLMHVVASMHPTWFREGEMKKRSESLTGKE